MTKIKQIFLLIFCLYLYYYRIKCVILHARLEEIKCLREGGIVREGADIGLFSTLVLKVL